jgi:hypothetical protein
MTTLKKFNDIRELSNSVSFYALVCMVVIFLVIVSYGWSTMLTPIIALPADWSPYLDPLFKLIRYSVGIAIAIVGVTLGKAVAAEQMRINSETDAKFKKTWWAYFAVLLFISALGTMNTMFMQTQQTSVLGEVISQTTKSLQKLKVKVDENLTTPAYDQQRTDVQQLFSNFEKELRNPANCGMGAQANKRFQELQSVLPKLKPLAIGSGACNNVNSLIDNYRGTVNNLLDDLPNQQIKKRYKQRVAITEKIDEQIVNIENLKVQNTSLDKSVALPVLNASWSVYAQALQEAELLANAEFGLPPEIVSKNAQGMGNITQILPLLISNLHNPLTYLIFFAAVIFDVLLIQFFSRYLHGLGLIREESIYTAQSNLTSGKASNLFED